VPQTADDLKFNIERSARYHSRREAFYDYLHKFSMGISLLAGSYAFAIFFQTPDHAARGKTVSAVVAIVTTLNLIFSFSHKARDHQILYRKFKQEAVNLAVTDDSDATALSVIEKQMLLIEIEEPPIYRALDASCYNETVRAFMSDQAMVYKSSIPLRIWHRLLMHFWRFSDTSFSPRGPKKLTPDAG
jgi:hypothetical protein